MQKITPLPKNNSAPPSAGRRSTLPMAGDRKMSMASSTGTEGRRKSASEFQNMRQPEYIVLELLN